MAIKKKKPITKEEKRVTIWKEDAKAVKVLRDLAVDFSKTVITCQEIDWKISAQNCGRMGRRFDNEKALDYSLMIADGEQFPYPIVADGEGGRFIIVAGYHRLKAQDLVDDTAPVGAYLAVIGSRELLEKVALMTNRREGNRTTTAECMEAAIRQAMMEEKPNYKLIAKEFRVVSSTLVGRVLSENLRKELAEFNCSAATTLKANQLKSLRKLRGNSRVLVEAALYVDKNGLSGDDTVEFVKGIYEQPTEALKLARIEKLSRVVTGKRLRSVPSSRQKITRLRDGVSRILSVLGGISGFADLNIAREGEEHGELVGDFKQITKLSRRILG